MIAKSETASAKRVATIGECMIELRHMSESTLAMGFGGDTLNTAVYLARVGAAFRVEYVTAMGDDHYSDRLVAAWQAEGVGTALVARLPRRLPGLYIIRTDAKGERSFTYFRSAAAARDMLREDRPAAIARGLAGSALVYFSGITLSILDEPQRHTLFALLEGLRRSGTLVAFDSNYRPAGWPSPEEARHWMTEALRRSDIALPTFDDEQKLFGDSDPPATARRIQALGVAEIVVKLGGEGCYIPDGDRRVPAERAPRVVDTTGAGDSFNAAYLAARLLDRPALEAARWGNRLAAVVVQHPGAIIPREAMPSLAETE
jgi:2-dehydro-3-deoxygluconokinase